MKKLLFGLGVSLCFGSLAHAQELPSFRRQDDPTMRSTPVSELIRAVKVPVTPLVLEPVAGIPDVFAIKPGTYVLRDALEILVAKTGGKAIFDDEFKRTNIYLLSPFQGTAPELIQKLTMLDTTVGRIGADWIFVKTKREAKNPTPLFNSAPTTPRSANPYSSENGFTRRLNPDAKPIDPKTLPPGAKSFEFNGERVYHVPLPRNEM